MRDIAIQFLDVTFGFGKNRPVFGGLSCEVRKQPGKGKIVALMGPSGIGKTTFCDLILSSHTPNAGSVILTPKNANLGLIPQKGVIFEELSVRDNISCLKHSRSIGHTFREDRVDQSVAALDLGSVLTAGTSASRLSGGEAQRVMLARIQTVDCDILILDEPCSFLDNRVKQTFLTALRETVADKGILALMVTHVWNEAKLVADEMMFFHQPHSQGVVIHQVSVDQAAAAPPTIDALFAIHWPECALFEIGPKSSSPNMPSIVIPRLAAQVAFFNCGPHMEDGTASSSNLYSQMLQQRLIKRGESKWPSSSAKPSRHAFYTCDGTIVA